jgi:hypothetical protein
LLPGASGLDQEETRKHTVVRVLTVSVPAGTVTHCAFNACWGRARLRTFARRGVNPARQVKTLRTPQRMVPVRVLLDDGRTLDGGFYVPAMGPDGKPGRLVDRLNDDSEEFLPLAGRYETLLNKSWIVITQVAAGYERAEGIEDEVAREQRVKMILTQNQAVEGWIRYLMPEEKARLLDYLNAAPRFIAVIDESRLTLVQRRFIISVEALTGASAVKRPESPPL